MKFFLFTWLLIVSLMTSRGATLANRWSFDTNTNDSAGGITGVLQGGAIISAGQLSLSGAGSSTAANRMIFASPIDIGGNFGATGVTIETWYTDTGTGTWGKLFQFGNNSAGQELGYTHTRGSGQMSGIDRDGAQLFGEQITQNEEHHLVITVSSDGNLSAWVDGVQKLTNTNTNDLSNVTTTFEAIGATSWGDPGMKGTVNEFRIWSGELTAGEVTSSLGAGPDNLPGNGPLISSFTSSHAARQEGESATLSWTIDDSTVTGTLNVEIRDSGNSIIHTSSAASGNTNALIGDTGGTPQSFTYTINTWDSDSPGDVRTGAVDIAVDPGIPAATPQSLQTVDTNPLTITLAGSDPNTHPNLGLTFSVITPPSGGILAGTAPNLTYTAQVGFSGKDSFTFRTNDGKYDSPPAIVTITVTKAPIAPTSLTFTTMDIPSTVSNGGYLATLITDDPNDEDTHTYALVSGTGSSDNTLFSIVGSQLRSASNFSGQVGNLFDIRLRTTDQGGLFFEQSFSLRVIEPLETIVINEIHANPPHNHVPQEFIELHNPSSSPKDLSGWRLSSAVDFVFPGGTSIPSGGYLVIAEDPETLLSTLGVTALGPFTGNLNSSGETVRLRDAGDAVIDQVDYKVGFPWPVASDGGGASIELINSSLDNALGSSWRASLPQVILPAATLLPYSDSNWSWRPGTTEASNPTSAWRAVAFTEDGTWTPSAQTPIGYGTITGVTLNTTVPDMRSNFNSVFLRNTFTIAPGEFPSQLQLNFTADDGLLVWINGIEVERRRFDTNEDPTIDDNADNTPNEGAFESKLVLNPGTFLNEGSNTIAVHLFNGTTNSSDLGFDIQVVRPGQADALAQPSPGAPNIAFANNAAPNIRKVDHLPAQPTSSAPVLITARVTDPEGVSSVSLEYRVIAPGSYVPSKLPLPIVANNINTTVDRPENPSFESDWTTVPMRDNGTSGDALAGDDLFSVTLPSAAHRSLVRYRITITDGIGQSARVPYPDDASLNFAYFVYDGIPTYQGINSATMGDTLPVYHLLTRSEDYAEAIAYNGSDQINQGTEARFLYNWNGSMVYDGKVYDNIRFRLRGANGRYQGRGKRSMRVRFNDGNFLEARDQSGKKFEQPWRTLTLGKGNSNRSTMTFGINEAVNYHLFQKMGVPAANPLFIQWRVVDDAIEAPDQWRGDYQGTYFVSETYDVGFLGEHDLEKGNLYKLINQTGDWEKQQRYQARFAPFNGSDHNTIEQNLDGNDTPAYIDAHVNLEKFYAFHALVEATRHYDYWPSANKNMVYYFEPDYLPANNNKGKLWLLPWDTDSSWGPTYNSGHNVVYNSLFDATGGGSDNSSNPTLWPAYYNTVREMRDLLWQEDQIGQVIDEFAAIIAPLVPADFARWKGAPTDAGNYNHLGGPGINSLANYVQDMKNYAFTGGSWPGGNGSGMGQANDNGISGTQGRDAFLDFLQGNNGESALLPSTPVLTYTGEVGFPTNALSFQTTAFSDPQGNGTFGALEWRLALINEPSALEIESSWESGEITSFVNSIDVPTTAVRSGSTYRARVRHQDSSGRWSHWSAAVEFTTSLPDLSDYLISLVITEVMYHPTDPTPAEIAAGFDDDDFFEYLELKNVGPAPLDLSEVRFTKGIDFDFINGTQTTLNPGQVILVVRSIPAFEMRYGTGFIIAGEWDPADKLNNKSDRVKLSFGAGDTIRDFTYLDASPWPVDADGNGNSLTLLNPTTVPDHTLASSWRASFSNTGTPGVDESDDPFADWLASQGETDPAASFNGSSLSNLLAYALGADLLTSGSPEQALPSFRIVEDGGENYPALSFRIRQGSNFLTYLPEVSGDLKTWQSGPVHTSQYGSMTDNGDGTSSLTVRSTTSIASCQFLRLRVIHP
jgi:hypothetical protein